MLKRYHQLHPEVLQEKEPGGKRARGSGALNIAKYREETTVAVEVFQDVVQKPMTHAQFEQEKACTCPMTHTTTRPHVVTVCLHCTRPFNMVWLYDPHSSCCFDALNCFAGEGRLAQ